MQHRDCVPLLELGLQGRAMLVDLSRCPLFPNYLIMAEGVLHKNRCRVGAHLAMFMDIMIQQVELQIPNMLKRGGDVHFWKTVVWGLNAVGMSEIETAIHKGAGASRTSTTEETSERPQGSCETVSRPSGQDSGSSRKRFFGTMGINCGRRKRSAQNVA